MIKINLVKTGKKGDVFSPVNLSVVAGDLGGANQLQKQALSRLLLFAIGPAALYIYYYQIQFPEIQGNINKIRGEVQGIKVENDKAIAARAALKNYEEERAKTNAKIKVVENLKAGRITEVKILDAIQKSMPPRVWIVKLEIKGAKVTIQGRATDAASVSAFEDALRSSIFLKDVLVQRVGETILQKGISGKEFFIDSSIESGLKEVGGAAVGTK